MSEVIESIPTQERTLVRDEVNASLVAQFEDLFNKHEHNSYKTSQLYGPHDHLELEVDNSLELSRAYVIRYGKGARFELVMEGLAEAVEGDDRELDRVPSNARKRFARTKLKLLRSTDGKIQALQTTGRVYSTPSHGPSPSDWGDEYEGKNIRKVTEIETPVLEKAAKLLDSNF